MRVLVIDDDEDIRCVARLSLEKVGGMEVLEAGSGEEGLSKAAEERPDAILLDVMMPGMDGAAVFAALRRAAATSGIPIVFLTAKAMAFEIARLKALGAAGVIVKPFDPMTLPDGLRRLLEPATA